MACLEQSKILRPIGRGSLLFGEALLARRIDCLPQEAVGVIEASARLRPTQTGELHEDRNFYFIAAFMEQSLSFFRRSARRFAYNSDRSCC